MAEGVGLLPTNRNPLEINAELHRYVYQDFGQV